MCSALLVGNSCRSADACLRREDASSTEQSSFGASLQDYLKRLFLPGGAAGHAQQLCELHDFSSARGHLIPSIPGPHSGSTVQRLMMSVCMATRGPET